MEESEFWKRYGGVLDRACAWDGSAAAPAPWPELKSNCVNVKSIEHECRPKELCVSFRPDGIWVDWMAQDSIEKHEKLDAELVRCMEAIGFHGKISVRLSSRYGDSCKAYELEAV